MSQARPSQLLPSPTRTARAALVSGALVLAAPSAAHAAFWDSPETVSNTGGAGEIALDTSPGGHSLLVAIGTVPEGDEDADVLPPAPVTIAAAGPGALPTVGRVATAGASEACLPAASVGATGQGLAAWCAETDPDPDTPGDDPVSTVVAEVISPTGASRQETIDVTEGAVATGVATVVAGDGSWVVVSEEDDAGARVRAVPVTDSGLGTEQTVQSGAPTTAPTTVSDLRAAATASGRAVITWIAGSETETTDPDTGTTTTTTTSTVQAARSTIGGGPLTGGSALQTETSTTVVDASGEGEESGRSIDEVNLVPEADPVLLVAVSDSSDPDAQAATARGSADGILNPLATPLPSALLTALAGGPGGGAALQTDGSLLTRTPFAPVPGAASTVADVQPRLAGEVAGTSRLAPGDSGLLAVEPAAGEPDGARGSVQGFTSEEDVDPVETEVDVVTASLRVLSAGSGALGAYIRDGGDVAVLSGVLRPNVAPPPPVVAPPPSPPPAPAPAPTPAPDTDEEPAEDRTAPKVTGLALSSTRFRLSTGASSFTGPRAAPRALSVRRLQRGTTLRFRLSERSRLQVDVYRLKLRSGPGAKRRCGTPLRKRGGKATKVASWRGTRGTGAVKVAFGGRRGSTALTRGRYVMRVVAVDAAGNRRIVRSPRFTLC